MTISVDDAQSISEGLRNATAVAHERAENASFVGDLMEGRLDAESYARLAAQLFFIYRALEVVGDELVADPATAPLVADVVDEKLRRVPRLTADLAVLGIDLNELEPLPSVAEYVAAIESTRDDPARYIAHHYTRYLGDLSGGQVIRSRMKLHYGLDENSLSFYAFDGIEKLKRYKDGYRDSLDALPLDSAARTRLIDEAIRAFEYNEALFAELSAE